MRKTFGRIAMLAMPAVLAAACGGDFFGTDGGTLDQGTGACVAGTTVHRIMDGAYNTTQATITSDTCNSPMLMPSDVMSVRNVMNDVANGVINVSGSNGGLIGSGPIRCNTGNITADQYITKDPCKYRSVRTSQMTVTGDSTFTLVFTDQQSEFMTTTGGTCVKPTSCMVQFTVQMQHQ